VATTTTQEVEYQEIKNLKEDANNPNKMSEAQIKALAESIKKYGFVVPIVTNKDLLIADGHQRLKAAVSLGIEKVPVIRLETEEVDRVILQQVLNKLKGNHVEALDKNIYSQLNEQDKLGELSLLTAIPEHELSKLLLQEPKIVAVDPDAVPDLRETSIQQGDVFELGKHRLLCGDIKDYAQIKAFVGSEKISLVLTDPPYNTGMSAKKGSTWLSHMFNDSFAPGEWEKLMQSSLSVYQETMDENSAIYLFLDWRRMHELIPLFKTSFSFSNLIVWDKVVHGLGSDYKYTYELIAVGKKGKPQIHTHTGNEYQDVWRVQREVGRNDEHATAKPTRLLTIPIRHATNRNQVVADFFGGSGSTLIACELTKRRCLMVELRPDYCQVIIDRWERFTGMKAKKIA
jgi:DNA modification methylase